MAVALLQGWIWFVVAILLVYATRHWHFTWSRISARQRPYYQDLLDSELPPVSVLVLTNGAEHADVNAVLEALVASNYARDLLEIIAVDDRTPDDQGAALNRALAVASHEIVLVFQAGNTPGRDLVRELAMAFIDPDVGAVVGRVVPRNSATNTVTRLLSLERSGGYQVDQQARYNLDLVPQYGGAVGGFRRSTVLRIGGFEPHARADDPDLTIRLYMAGWRVLYANHAECYEDVPDTWSARFAELRHWARGHDRAFFTYIGPLLRSHNLTRAQKIDAALLLFSFIVPPILLTGIAANAVLFYLGAFQAFAGIVFSFFVVSYNAFGSFAPLFESGAAELLDGARQRLFLLPYLFYLFVFNSWAITLGAFDALRDRSAAGVSNAPAL